MECMFNRARFTKTEKVANKENEAMEIDETN